MLFCVSPSHVEPGVAEIPGVLFQAGCSPKTRQRGVGDIGHIARGKGCQGMKDLGSFFLASG